MAGIISNRQASSPPLTKATPNIHDLKNITGMKNSHMDSKRAGQTSTPSTSFSLSGGSQGLETVASDDADDAQDSSGDDADDDGDDSVDGSTPSTSRNFVSPSARRRFKRQASSQRAEATESWMRLNSEDDFDDADSQGDLELAADEDELAVDGDDDYDDVDRISVSSDGSKNFEQDIEQEILDAGEDAIDWDDDNIFEYDDSWERTDFFSTALEAMEPSGSPFLGLLANAGADLLVSPEIAAAPDMYSSGTLAGHLMPDVEWSVTEESDSESEGTRRRTTAEPTTKKKVDVDTPGPRIKVEDNDDTDEEDLSSHTLNSPGMSGTTLEQVALGRSNSIVEPCQSTQTPKRKLLKPSVIRGLPFNPKKPIVFHKSGPNGRYLEHFIPKNIQVRWIDITTSREGSTAMSSPTMVDLDAALGEGNTRTGACITDAIYGQLFMQFHCPAVELIQPIAHNVTEFARRAMRNGSAIGHAPRFEEDRRGDDDDVLLSLINYDDDPVKDEEKEQSSDDAAPVLTARDSAVSTEQETPVRQDTRLHPNEASSLLLADDNMAPFTPDQTMHDGLMTPTPSQRIGLSALKLGERSSSPLKRHGSDASMGQADSSPVLKRSRLATSGEANLR